ncbi:MAG: RHS repeat-associated core domain-containing protein, partial [Ktedonobacteraceae bacterium]
LYAPYGSSRFTAGTPTNYTNKGYTGQYNDFVSGLDYYNARYYDPVSGVFLSADTVEGNNSGMNPYAYAGGNPATYSDPTGEMECTESECRVGGGEGGDASSSGGGGSGGGLGQAIVYVIGAAYAFLSLSRDNSPSPTWRPHLSRPMPTPTAPLTPTATSTVKDIQPPEGVNSVRPGHTTVSGGGGRGKQPPKKPTATSSDEPPSGKDKPGFKKYRGDSNTK